MKITKTEIYAFLDNKQNVVLTQMEKEHFTNISKFLDEYIKEEKLDTIYDDFVNCTRDFFNKYNNVALSVFFKNVFINPENIISKNQIIESIVTPSISSLSEFRYFLLTRFKATFENANYYSQRNLNKDNSYYKPIMSLIEKNYNNIKEINKTFRTIKLNVKSITSPKQAYDYIKNEIGMEDIYDHFNKEDKEKYAIMTPINKEALYFINNVNLKSEENKNE